MTMTIHISSCPQRKVDGGLQWLYWLILFAVKWLAQYGL